MKQEELKKLLDTMSLQEKIDQMLQLTGDFYQDADSVLTGPAVQLGVTGEDVHMAGSILGTCRAEKLIKIQKRYMENHPHHIPLLFMMDIIHGMKTIFPIPLGQGASFEPELSKRCAAAAAKEAAVSGLHVTFAPMVDLVRDARWGRVMESTGEDTWLNSLFARAMVEGFQGDDLKEPYKVAACVKHFAAYGAPQAGREYHTVELSENTLREYYLPAYQAGIDAKAAMVMTSFNTVNGIPASTNRWLMRDILREEMGFDGVLISDFSAILETIAHGCSEDSREAAVKALEAGVDIDMMTNVYTANLRKLTEEGVVQEAWIDQCVMRILELKNKLGLFENPYKDADTEKEKEIFLCPEHRALAREAAVKSFVLLENDGVLPLDMGRRTAFIGPYTDSKQIKSSWSFTGDDKDCVSIKEAAGKVFDGSHTVYLKGAPVLGSDSKESEARLTGFTGDECGIMTREEEVQMQKEAVEAAKEADLVIMPLGEHYLQSGEAASRAQITVPEVQMELFRAVHRVNKNIVVVLFCGRPLDIREISQKARAVLVVWRPGTEGGSAVVDVLTGKENPSGRLPMSFPYCVGQVPVHYNEFSTGRPDRKGIQERFRSKYLDIPNEPLYPFGYGLGYTRFSLSQVKLDKTEMREGDTIHAGVMLKNIGERKGTETVQFYIRDMAASVVRPVKELKGFEKVTLEPGEEREIIFAVEEPMLRFHTEQNGFASEAGEFLVFAGTDSRTENRAGFRLVK